MTLNVVSFWIVLVFGSTVWALGAPKDLTAVAVSTSQINLSYVETIAAESGFVIERSLSSSSGFAEIARTGKNVTAYSSAGLSPNTIYYYRVKAFKNRNGSVVYSVYSNVATTKTQAPPPPSLVITVGPTVSNITLSSARISWTVSEFATGQIEYGRTLPYDSFSVLEPSFSYQSHAQTLSGLASGALYNYRVISRNAAGVQVVSENKTFVTTASVTTTTMPPTTTTTMPPVQPPAGNFTHFVRPDGGTSAQCNGMANSAYPGSGANLNCAWKSITYALGIGTASKIKSGDKLYIESGTYKIGHKAPGYELNPGKCYDSYPSECAMSKIPSGVTIEGNCSSRPKLVGVEGVSQILDFSDTSFTTVKCLEVTDGINCINRHNTANGLEKKPCKTTAPFGEWAYAGVYAQDSSNVVLDRVNIHGFAAHGVNAARLKDWTFLNSNIDANGWAGWDGNLGATTSSNSGLIKFIGTSISFNGCMEKAGGGYEGCWGQISGGYGDGIGTEATGGTWIFDGATVVGNTSDGIDMLYVKNAGGNVIVKNSYISSNAGNQVKTNQDALIENNVVVANCSYHTRFNGTMTTGEFCRAKGNALSIGLSPGQVGTVKNNTITGEGDCLVLSNSSSTGGGTINITGNILDGREDYTSGDGSLSCFYYYNGTGSITKNVSSNLIYNVKEGCQAGQVCQNPKFVNPSYSAFDPHLQSGSPAVGFGASLNAVPLP